MTYITKLSMKGFKSFANKTELPFSKGFNCILGPNGSGKSNVLDAICFVLGKASAKGLRAEKSANLIYNGGKTKPPAKEGMVSISFDNSSKIFGKEFDELTITRTVKQNGQSIYKINGKKATRQEVVDTLNKAKINPDGYNIILQGDITRIVGMTPLERRGIIEEISGISIYESKKTKAIRELERVEQKLNEADIILAERKAYLKELKKERDQAARFKELNDKIKRNKKTIIVKKIAERSSELKNIEKKIASLESEIKKLKDDEARIKLEISEKKGEIESINKEVERRGEKEQVTIHKQVERLKVDLALKKQRVSLLSDEIKKVKQRKEELKKTNKELFDKIKLIEKEEKETKKAIDSREANINLLEKRLAEYRKKHKMEDAAELDSKIIEIDRKIELISSDLATLREEQQKMLREKDRLEIKLEQADEQIAKVLEVEQANKEAVSKLKRKKDEFKKATKELSTSLANDSAYAAELRTARQKLFSKQEELNKLQARNNSLREGLAAGMAVKKIIEQKRRGVYGTVAELGSVSAEHALALEVAAGSRMNSIVVENDKVAAECINYLRKNKLGVATFLPINKIKSTPPTPMPKKQGVIGRAADLISFDNKFTKVFNYVFGSTLVVKDIESARSIGIGSARMVTLKGDLIESSGAMTGGFRNKQRSAGFQQKELSEKIMALESEISDLESVVTALERKRRNNEELITRLRELKANLEGDIITIEKTLHLDSKDLDMNKTVKRELEKDLKSLDKEISKILGIISSKNKDLANLKIEKQKLRDQMIKMRSPAVLAQLNTFEEKKNELREEINTLKAKMRAAESEKRNVLGPESEKITQILKQHDKELQEFSDEQAEIKGEIIEMERELKEKETLEKKFFEQFKELFQKRQKLADKVGVLEKKFNECDNKIRQLESGGQGLSIRAASLKAELAGLEEEEKQYDDVEPFSNKPLDEIKLEIKQFERMMGSMGAVNMKALEIYDKVEEEYKTLIEKKNKLFKEREDVLVMINSIDSKKKELFMKTFNIINKNFQEIFSMLSDKGTPYLSLEDEKDPFNGGMTIKLKLTPKKYLDIRLLSGGEKTLTALSFLFAVQEYEPASFYVLDEVDAALDKHNSEKLAKLIRAYCRNAQYIIITHNDNIISEADNLYGISLGAHKISQVTSLKL